MILIENKSEIKKIIIGSFLLICGIAIFVGSLIMFGYCVAPTLFTILPTKDLAGMVNQAILVKFRILQGISILMMLGGFIICKNKFIPKERNIHIAFISVIMILFLFYGIYIHNTMFTLAQSITSFDSILEHEKALIQQFRQYHRYYSATVLIAASLGLGLILYHLSTLMISGKEITIKD
jgi:hypothetical protein